MSTGRSGQTPLHIRSPDNRIYRFVRSLRRRSMRETERAFVVEGMRAVEDALAAGAAPRYVLLRVGDAAAELVGSRHRGIADLRMVDPTLFNELTDTVTPQGVLAVFETPSLSVDLSGSPLVLVIDRMRDPGNLGTLLRSAAGAGVTLVLLTRETVDPFNPKAVRAAMGAHFRVPMRAWTDDLQRSIERSCPSRFVADADAPTLYDAVDWHGGTALIIGSEAHGVSPKTAALATDRVSSPLSASVESLNAAVAGSVILFEAVRQRRHRLSSPGKTDEMHPGILAKT